MIENIIALPFRAAWNLVVLAGSIALFFVWWPFLFGSVIGVVLVLIFAPALLVWPLGLLIFLVPMWD